MNWFELIRFSLGNLLRRKLRTSLTVLGVMIGTASIVVMMSLGIGLDYSYTQQLKNSATLTRITVNSGYYYDGGNSSDTPQLTDDTVAGFSAMEHVTCASPVYNFGIMLKSGKFEAYGDIYAVSLEMLEAMKPPIISGEMLKEGDSLRFLVGKEIGYNFYDPSSMGGGGYFYYAEDESGERPAPSVDLENDQVYAYYDMNGYYENTAKKYQLDIAAVTGDPTADYGATEFDYSMFADIDAVKETFTKIFKKNPWPNQQTDKNGKPITPFVYNQAYVLVDNIDNVKDVQKQITDMGFNAYSEADWLESMQEQSKTIQYVLAGIGSVSLIVAAIGITNTMLMSIFERTKEIGIFKVLGCSLKNIRSMFLVEAGLIGFGGGIAGVVLSFLLSFGINKLIGEVSVIPAWLALVGIGFAVLVGMIAGISPASRAMKLSPLEAIRTL